MSPYEAVLEHIKLAHEYATLPLNVETEEEGRVIIARKKWIMQRVEELRIIERKWNSDKELC